MNKIRANVLPEPEPVTIRQLQEVIPPHCFERSNIRSFGYVFMDLFNVAVVTYAGTNIDFIPWISVRWLVWVLFWFASGTVMLGVWVIGHECGHQSFSPSLWVNDTVGCIAHTVFFTPYWSWKYSHAQHHSKTNSMEYESAIVPRTDLNVSDEENTLPGRIWAMFKMLSVGWWAYIWFNYASNPEKSVEVGWNSHVNPFCVLWKNRQQKTGVIASDIAILVWVWILYRLSCYFGLMVVIKFYGIPYLWVNTWVTILTYLHHTDWAVPRYYDGWSWLRGALGTVDRDYGVFNFFQHHLSDTHVLHHIFSRIPHYHAQEATQAILDSGLISNYYLMDTTPWYIALWNSYRDCQYVQHAESVAWFTSHSKMKDQ